jgi:carbamoylphosphate synthase small subunit
MGFLWKQARDLHNPDNPSNWKKSKPSWMDRKVWEESVIGGRDITTRRLERKIGKTGAIATP